MKQPGQAGRQHAGKQPVTVLVTTCNESLNIEACLRSVQWAREIIVVDSGSEDDTVQRARPWADQVLHHPYESPARQKNWAIGQAGQPWVLILDADERVTEPLQRDLEQALEAGPACHGYWIRRRNTFLGREIRHGDWGRDKVIRFFARGRALYEDVLVHEEMQVDGQVGILRGQLLHHSVRSLRQHGVKLDRYADWWAEQGVRRGRRASAPVVLGHVLGRFVGTYLLRGGFLDGGHGLVLALVDTYGVFLKYARLWERQRQEPAPE